MRMVRTPIVFAVMALGLLGARVIAAEGTLDDAKKLYAAASFESALVVLEEVNRGDDATQRDVLEYRALCLIALGRVGEAQAAVDALVAKSPAFLPTGDDISPRFVALLNDSRSRLLPDITKRLFNTAREQFRARNNSVAREQFEEVVRFADDEAWAGSSEAVDFRTLASGFLELMDASVKSNDATPPVGTAAVAAAAEPSGGSTPAVLTRQRTELQPPVQIAQVLPKWRPTDAVMAQRRFTGAVRVRIGKDLNAAKFSEAHNCIRTCAGCDDGSRHDRRVRNCWLSVDGHLTGNGNLGGLIDGHCERHHRIDAPDRSERC